MSENSLSFVVKHDAPWNTIDMTLNAGNDSSVTVRFKVGEITNMPDPTLTDLRNVALSWAAHQLLEQLPADYLDGRAKFVPGPRKPQQ